MEAETDFVAYSPTNNYIFPSSNTSTEICNFNGLHGANSITDLLSDPNCLRYTFNWTLFLIILYAILYVFGLVVNGLVAFIVGLKRGMHTSENLFFANMAVAEIFFIGFCLPATLLSNIFILWIPSEKMCKAVSYIQGVSRLSSAFSVIAVSLDGYRAIYYPSYQADEHYKYSVRKVLIMIWTIAAFLSLPYLFVFELVYLPETGTLPHCQELWDNPNFGKLYYVMVHLAYGFLVPLIVVTICVFLITWKIVTGRLFPNFGSEDEMQADPALEETERKKNCRFVILLTVLIITFCLCWLPFHVLVFKAKFPIYFDGNNSWEIIVTPLAQLLVVLNSCFSPIIYMILSTKFRQTLGSICRRPDPNCIDCAQEHGFAMQRRVYEEINCENLILDQLGLQENPQYHQGTSTLSSEQGRRNLVLGVTTAQVPTQSETSSESERAIESIDV